MDGHTVLSAMTGEVLAAASSLGLDADAIARDAGLDREALADPDGRVPLAAHFRAWEILSQRPIGLELGTRLGVSGMGVLGYAMQHGATVADALELQRRHRAVIHPDVVPAYERRRDAGEERLVFSRPVSPAFARLREPVLAQASAIVSVMRILTGRAVSAQFVSLPLPRPGDPSREERFFGCPVSWSAPRLEVAFDAALLDLTLPRSDSQLFGYLARRAADLHARLPTDASWTDRARSAIGAQLPSGEPRLADLARRLAVSERTLHRRLESEGTGFAALVDAERRERALLLVDDPSLSAGEIAFLLGYSEPAVFFRAFKRWTGETPSSHRAKRRAPA
jgi:AraC-like DNA-binding protein